MDIHKTDAQIADALKAVSGRESVTDIFFVACGGSFSLMLTTQYITDREASRINGIALNAAEFTARAPKTLGRNSLVIACSHSGTTPETVEAIRFARQAGALTISLTNVLGSPLDDASEFTIAYKHTPLEMSSHHSAAILSRLALGIVKVREGNNKADDFEAALTTLPRLVDQKIADLKGEIATFAEAHKRDSVIYTMASGSNYGVAYCYAICLFQEMLWIHSAAIQAGEYFHGPFEVTDFDVPFVQLMGVGPTRAIDERAFSFAQKYSRRVTALDARKLGISDFPESIAEYLTPLLFTPILRAYMEKLAEAKGHPLTVRRYMWKLEY
ncbi:SIS domain-containing protein [Rhizobium brockwellii]|uniref:SIS domain-containing protein n=1 Tax=Rhizobium brockwellii TaxID=3019932 RepID=UPI000522F972|nr:SIS domain-containing protein [Rhizobium brockwellii]KPN22749.1 hypothetical protein KS05_32230 [Rhizobium brockwellii]QJX10031.1 SIS domain-containing protein [Rhizobium brockwellii]